MLLLRYSPEGLLSFRVYYSAKIVAQMGQGLEKRQNGLPQFNEKLTARVVHRVKKIA